MEKSQEVAAAFWASLEDPHALQCVSEQFFACCCGSAPCVQLNTGSYSGLYPIDLTGKTRVFGMDGCMME